MICLDQYRIESFLDTVIELYFTRHVTRSQPYQNLNWMLHSERSSLKVDSSTIDVKISLQQPPHHHKPDVIAQILLMHESLLETNAFEEAAMCWALRIWVDYLWQLKQQNEFRLTKRLPLIPAFEAVLRFEQAQLPLHEARKNNPVVLVPVLTFVPEKAFLQCSDVVKNEMLMQWVRCTMSTVWGFEQKDLQNKSKCKELVKNYYERWIENFTQPQLHCGFTSSIDSQALKAAATLLRDLVHSPQFNAQRALCSKNLSIETLPNLDFDIQYSNYAIHDYALIQ